MPIRRLISSRPVSSAPIAKCEESANGTVMSLRQKSLGMLGREALQLFHHGVQMGFHRSTRSVRVTGFEGFEQRPVLGERDRMATR